MNFSATQNLNFQQPKLSQSPKTRYYRVLRPLWIVAVLSGALVIYHSAVYLDSSQPGAEAVWLTVVFLTMLGLVLYAVMAIRAIPPTHSSDLIGQLALLYEAITTVNQAWELDDLLIHFMHRLADHYAAGSGVVRILKNNQLELIGSFGGEDKNSLFAHSIPVRELINNGPSAGTAIEVRTAPVEPSPAMAGRSADGMRQMVFIPLQYRDSILGCYQLMVGPKIDVNAETRELLANIGCHLGIAIEQSRLDQEAGTLLMVEERARLANELHDSLAQTLASLRIQVRVVDETLHQGDEQVTWEEMEKLESTVEEANSEFRRLIGQFRAPLQSQEVVISVEKLIRRFRRDTGIAVFFQNEWTDDHLPQELRTDVIRIVQESLANIKKHADAKTVRVLLRHQAGRCRLMVEDDGTGFDDSMIISNSPGEHIGLKIMTERAENLGAALRVESEPGDGSRIALDFAYGDFDAGGHSAQPLAG